MLFVKFQGGLGNQMYQYAFYFHLKEKYPEIEVKADLDRYLYKKYLEHNGFELQDVFENMDLDVAATKEIMQSGGAYERHKYGIVDIIKRKIWNNYLWKRRIDTHNRRVTESEWSREFNSLTAEEIREYNLWLCGYWAGDWFWREADFDLAEIFKFRDTLDQKNSAVLEEIKASESVSIHVRRGDYIENHIKTPGMQYYINAVNILCAHYPHPYFFVFSDDKQYIKENFSFIDNVKIIDYNTGKDSYKDMLLMSYCKNNIICNSTFSMWAATLNQNENKMVIAPQEYLAAVAHGKKGNWLGIEAFYQ